MDYVKGTHALFKTLRYYQEPKGDNPEKYILLGENTEFYRQKTVHVSEFASWGYVSIYIAEYSLQIESLR